MAPSWWPFGRKRTDDKNVETLLEEANAATPTRPAAPVAEPFGEQVGDGSFRLPVEDVFLITGRGCVVTGRIEAGLRHRGHAGTGRPRRSVVERPPRSRASSSSAKCSTPPPPATTSAFCSTG